MLTNKTSTKMIRRMNKLDQLEQNLHAARHTRRKLIVQDDGKEFTAIFWLPNGDDVRRWVGRDTDLCAAIHKAGTEYAVEMLAAHIFGNQPLPQFLIAHNLLREGETVAESVKRLIDEKIEKEETK